MCKINCSGGCPECSPEDHDLCCKEMYELTEDCLCDGILKPIVKADGTTALNSIYRGGGCE